MAEQPLLQPLGALSDHRIVLQVAGDLAQQVVQGGSGRVLPVGADRPQPLHRLVVGPADDPAADEAGRPARRPLADGAVGGVGVPAQPGVHLADHQVDETVMGSVGDDRVEQVAHGAGQRLGLQPRNDHLTDQLGDVVVLDVGECDAGQP